jgi:Mrp family chromosome partitioning ATPase
MSRIFDALRKAGSRTEPDLPVSPAAPAPSFAAPVGRPLAPSAAERPLEPLHGHPLAAAVELSDDVAQQMTTLRVNLESALGDRACRIVMFQSAQGGEGTSTVTHQFAWTLARDRSLRTLVLDAHAERPTIELDPAHRVATCLIGGGRASATGPEIAMNLHGLPVPEEYRATGLYTIAAARERVEAASGVYDWVLLDGPPLLETADAVPLSAIADGVVLVVQAGRTKRPVLSRAVELVGKAGGRVLGCVLNRRQLEIPEFIYRRL